MLSHSLVGISMKAIVLAGGFATRLRPISYVIPKLLFPVAGKPMIYWTLDLLKRFQVDEVVLGVNYLAEDLRNAVGDNYRGMRITYSLEESPLGTAGPIKLASKITKLTKTFISMNGDIIANINLDEMLQRHRLSKVLITDALREVQDPSRFGVVEIDTMARIARFLEKPNRNETRSRLVNAGVYLIEPSVLKEIASGRKVSLEREIFPTLARRGRLGGFVISDYWFDIGNVSDYRKANFALTQKIAGNSVQLNCVGRNSNLVPPILIGRHTSVGREARLGPNAILGNNVVVDKSVKISNSIIFDGVEIGQQSTVIGAILASNATIGKKVKIEQGAIISPKVLISDGVRVGRGAIIHPYREITKNIRPWTQVM
jgi:NDP-sugar pyrophosphorylase family protein